MNTRYSKALFMASVVASTFTFMVCQSAFAFNPQPEPPAHEEQIPSSINPAAELRSEKAKNPAPPPPPNKLHKAMEPGDDEKPHEMNERGNIIENKPSPWLKR